MGLDKSLIIFNSRACFLSKESLLVLLCFQETLPRWDASALTQLCAGLAASRRAARQPLESLEVKGVNGWGRLVHRCVEASSRSLTDECMAQEPYWNSTGTLEFRFSAKNFRFFTFFCLCAIFEGAAQSRTMATGCACTLPGKSWSTQGRISALL